jgi:chromosome segregation ATPase
MDHKEGCMPNRSVLEQESSDLRKSIANLEAQIKGVREYIAAQERNLRNAAESIRHITERGLAEARSDLHLKEIRLQQLRQDLLTSQAILGKLGEIERKQQDIQTLERERDRIIDLLERAHSDLQRLNNEYLAMTSPTGVSEYALILVLTFSVVGIEPCG